MNRPAARLQKQASAPARFTAAEFLRMADLGAFNDMKVGLDHGELVRMNPPHTDHAFALAGVLRKLFAAVDRADIAVVPEITIMLPDETVRAFDAALVRSSATGERALAPEHVLLAIEVSDTTLEFDLGSKLRDYALAGIPHYWVVDAQAKAVHVMARPAEDRYRHRRAVRFGEPLDLPEGRGAIVLD